MNGINENPEDKITRCAHWLQMTDRERRVALRARPALTSFHEVPECRGQLEQNCVSSPGLQPSSPTGLWPWAGIQGHGAEFSHLESGVNGETSPTHLVGSELTPGVWVLSLVW